MILQLKEAIKFMRALDSSLARATHRMSTFCLQKRRESRFRINVATIKNNSPLAVVKKQFP